MIDPWKRDLREELVRRVPIPCIGVSEAVRKAKRSQLDGVHELGCHDRGTLKTSCFFSDSLYDVFSAPRAARHYDSLFLSRLGLATSGYGNGCVDIEHATVGLLECTAALQENLIRCPEHAKFPRIREVA